MRVEERWTIAKRGAQRGELQREVPPSLRIDEAARVADREETRDLLVDRRLRRERRSAAAFGVVEEILLIGTVFFQTQRA